MTAETCVKYYEQAKAKNNKIEMEFWKARALKKGAVFKEEKTETKSKKEK